jgi:hypothetical protein
MRAVRVVFDVVVVASVIVVGLLTPSKFRA